MSERPGRGPGLTLGAAVRAFTGRRPVRLGALLVLLASLTVWPAAAATPTLATQASASGFPVGVAIFDVATLGGGENPTGTITFTLFGPGNATCTGAPTFSSTKVVAGNGNYTSDSFTTTQAGTYQWIAAYSGDANNTPVTTACNDPNAQVTVTKKIPVLAGAASPPSGGQIVDVATLSNGAGPTGTVTFTLFGPDNLTCAGAPVFTSTKTVAGNGTYTSDAYAPTTSGTYRWVVTYSGDANNIAAGTLCSDPAQAVNVTVGGGGPVTPTLTTQASAGVALGGQVTDTATVAGGNAPTGTITFTLYGPNDATCATAPVFTNTKTVTGNGSYTSDPFTPTAAGTYRWRAAYSGDAGNNPVSAACNAPNESVVVSGLITPTLTTQASAGVALGGQVTDTATLAGGNAPTGTITFTLFGPDDATCVTAPVFTNTKTVTGNGSYTSDPFTPTAAGTYRWRAAYSGDAGNSPVSAACNAPDESVLVTGGGGGPVTPTLTTQASAGVALGGQVTDTATVAGGNAPTGTITFTLYGPDDATCTTPPVFTNTKPVTGNGSYTSDAFTPTAAGTYRWRAAYSGDAGNNAVSAACNAPNESVVVTATPAPPSITLAKTATPASLPEPGGNVTFALLVTNTGAQGVTLTGLTDNVYGNVSGLGNCATGGTIAPAGTYACSFPAMVTGDAGSTHTDIVTATATNSAGATATASDDATVSITNALPVGSVVKTASPASRPAPGGAFTFGVTVTNSGQEPFTITALTDDIYGNLATQGTCTNAVGTVLAAGAAYSCQFTGTFTGVAGASQTDVVSVTATDDDDTTATFTDSATVTITAAVPQISVVKAPAPASLPEPGGTFAFTVTVANTGAVPVTITALADDTYGNVSTQGTCTTAVGTVLPPSGTYSCTFPGAFTGAPGATHTNVVTATATDSAGTVVTATDSATVAITAAVPAIVVDKSASPGSLPEPGGTFAYAVTVTNVSTVALRLTGLTDDVYGNLNGKGTCATGATLAANGGTYACAFTAPFTGNAGASLTDTVTATATTLGGGATATDTDTATVAITNTVPTVSVGNTVDPPSRPEQGGTFTHTVTVTNGSAEPVTISALVDDVYGDLTTRSGSTCTSAKGTLLQPGGTYTCTFTATFTGEGGASVTDTVAATVTDDEGSSATGSDSVTKTLTDVPPKVGVSITASPSTLPAPGGTVTYTVRVTNLSNPEAVTITVLRSDVHGDLNGRGTCKTGVTLAAPPAAGDTFTCSFTVAFTGAVGDRLAPRVTVTVVDNEGTQATATSAEGEGTVVLTEAAATPAPTTPAPTTAPASIVTGQPVARTGGESAVPVALALLLVVGGVLILEAAHPGRIAKSR